MLQHVDNKPNPPKLKDQRSFTILYTIERQSMKTTLCDLRANINLMPYSIFTQLGMGETIG